MQTRVALTLRMVAGLTVAEIARAFLVQETTVGRRITRAKAKIKAARSCRPSPPGHHSKRIAAPLRSAWIRS
jgi:RNA polymerase sigma-70 factor (ECF subfamily)